MLAKGEQDKMKSGMEANANDQDMDTYPDHSSPAVAIHSIFSCLIATALNKFKVAEIDVD